MNIGNITISVIIPVYNASVTLPHCLDPCINRLIEIWSFYLWMIVVQMKVCIY